MNAIVARRITFTLAVALAGCAAPNPRCPVLPGGGAYCLQSTAGLPAFEALQKVDASFNGRRETLIVELEVDASGLRMAGLTPFGHKIVQIAYDNRAASATTLPDPRLDPTLLTALVQLALWPAEAVRAGLAAPLQIVDSPLQRRISDADGQPLLTVDREGEQPPFARLRLTLPAANLELDIETLPGPGQGEGK